MALEVAHISTTTLPHLLGRAHRAAMGVAGSLDSSALDDELAAMLGAAADAAAATAAVVESTETAPAEAAQEEEEEEEEAGFGGLGDLFG